MDADTLATHLLEDRILLTIISKRRRKLQTLIFSVTFENPRRTEIKITLLSPALRSLRFIAPFQRSFAFEQLAGFRPEFIARSQRRNENDACRNIYRTQSTIHTIARTEMRVTTEPDWRPESGDMAETARGFYTAIFAYLTNRKRSIQRIHTLWTAGETTGKKQLK